MDQNHLQELIRKYANNTATPEETQELHDWYRSIHSIETVEWPATDPGEKEDLTQRMLQRLERQLPPRIYYQPWLRVAASLILIAGAWIVWQSTRSHEMAWRSLHNPSGKIQSILLPDSSQVWLNAESSLRYAADFHKEREIYLEGEAYFEVTEDKAHPFTVHAGTLTTTVLGTGFDIRSFATESQNDITVIRGKVQVAHNGKVLDQLTAARQLQWDNNGSRSQTVSVDTNQVLGWQHGQLLFKGQTMDEITAALGRWYNVHFVFKDTAMRRCRYYVNFKNTIPLKDLLKTMSLVNDMSFAIDDKNHIVTLSGKGCQ